MLSCVDNNENRINSVILVEDIVRQSFEIVKKNVWQKRDRTVKYGNGGHSTHTLKRGACASSQIAIYSNEFTVLRLLHLGQLSLPVWCL